MTGILRVKATFSVLLPDAFEEELNKEFGRIADRVNSDCCVIFFEDVELISKSSDNSTTFADIKKLVDSPLVFEKHKIFNARILFNSHSDSSNPMVLISQTFEVPRHVVELPVDVLISCSDSITLLDLHSSVVNKINEQLLEMKSTIEKHQLPSVPRPYHFLMHSKFITIIYLDELPEQKLENTRKELHEKYDLPLDRPVFRRANACDLALSLSSRQQLVVDGANLSSCNSTDLKADVMLGRCLYYHYLHDDINDNGWGCAYRSLQTIWSWFLQQGYVSAPVPSHNDIQKVLVEIGDKPASFIGSQKWIGSMEISYVLDHCLGIQCRTISLSSGSKLALNTSDISRHFKTNGTPIMIGGGVLAHTILGVIQNSFEPEKSKFLVLDPHYTGSDDWKMIKKKGFLAYKPISFWNADSFYNICLPLKPRII